MARNRRAGIRYTRLSVVTLMEATGSRTARELGLMVGMTRSNVQRLKGTGLTIYQADKLAIRCGLHPLAVWGDDYFQALYKEAS